MNAPLDHRHLETASVEGDFALERSRCIDAFAKLELQVTFAAERLGIGFSRECLGRRVASLNKAKPSPLLSKANAAKLAVWVEATEVLVARRASIVHAVMGLGNFSGVWKASFENAFDVVAKHPIALLVTIEGLRNIRVAVEAQTDELSTLVKGLEAKIV